VCCGGGGGVGGGAVEHRAAEIAATGQVKHAEEKKKHDEHPRLPVVEELGGQ
jgi:hypothetical protein